MGLTVRKRIREYIDPDQAQQAKVKHVTNSGKNSFLYSVPSDKKLKMRHNHSGLGQKTIHLPAAVSCLFSAEAVDDFSRFSKCSLADLRFMLTSNVGTVESGQTTQM